MKTLMIRDEVYEKLKSLKRKNESFSDLLERLISQIDNRTKLEKYFGILSNEEAKKLESEVFRVRKELTKSMASKFDKVLKELENNH
ncbi:MAG: antitoxin VapB family protein [Candidatus Asgardarchaeia archaeon]